MDNGETDTTIIQNLVTIRHDLVCLTWSEEMGTFTKSLFKICKPCWIRKITFSKLKQIYFLWLID